MKKYILPAGILTACLCMANLSASAYTVDDVAQKARDSGWPEYLIQSGYNEWSSGNYSQEQLDDVYNSLEAYDEEIGSLISELFGIDNTTTENTESTENNTENEKTSETQAETGISSAEFINMSLDEKVEYVNSLDETSKSEFIASLSTEEKNSILKQLPTEQKLEVMQSYIDTADTMGMNVVVDSISGENISVTIRNEDGVVIDQAAVGVTIDETGISHTKPLVFAGIGVLVSLVGFGVLYEYIRRTES